MKKLEWKLLELRNWNGNYWNEEMIDWNENHWNEEMRDWNGNYWNEDTGMGNIGMKKLEWELLE